MNATDALRQAAARMIERYRMLDGVNAVGVAVSGGADSVCLFHVLRALALAPKVAIVHVNHLLRGPESDADEEFVRLLARRFDVPLYVHRADVRALEGNLEETARRVRYDFFRGLIATGAVDCVATGHTQSDQAETVLFRLLRGAHLAGLAAIHPVVHSEDAPGPIIRPLLDVSRREVELALVEMGEHWREDGSNRDLAFDRNRIRHVLMPTLEREWNPEIGRTLGHLAALAYDEERFWAGWLGQYERDFLQVDGNIVLICASKLVEQPVAVARRLIRKAIETVRGDLHQIEFAHVEQILGLARSPEGSGRLQAPRVDVFRSFDWLRFAPLAVGDQLAARNQETACRVPGRASLAGARVEIALEVIENTGISSVITGTVENARVKGYELDWDRVLELGSELHLRTWKPGDQYRPAGERAERKLKTMFQESRIPLWDRGTWPIITVGTQIVWARKFGPAAEVAAAGASRRILCLTELTRD